MVQSSPFHQSLHVSESDLGPRWHACPLCGYSGSRAPVASLQREPHVELLGCPACGGASATRFPTQAFLSSYYASYYANGGEEAVTVHDTRSAGNHIAEALGGIDRQARLRMMDFGAGDGSLGRDVAMAWLGSTQASGIDLVLVDPTPPAIEAGSLLTVEHVESLDALRDSTFDRIIASAILEHVPRPGNVLQQLVSRLSPGGRLYARTPWISSFARHFPGFDVGFPAHLHDLGPDWWERSPELYGLPARLIRSRTSFVEASWQRSPLRYAIAKVAKAPSSLLRVAGLSTSVWPWVGGWEVVFERDDA